jgi:hypothetical protein
MAVTGIYYGIAVADLLTMRTNVLAQIQKAQQGKRFASLAGAGKSFSKDNLSLDELKGELAEIKAALQKADPSTYGRRVRRLHVAFNSCPSELE